MIKITALNEVDSGEDTGMKVSKEALEQIAIQHYATALDLQSKGNVEDAIQLYKDLLGTELLDDVKKPDSGESSTQLFHLKYLCYKNLATSSSYLGKLEEAIEAYEAAIELDNSDVSLWHQFGQVCMQANHFESALYAFQKGVECNPRHWPCLDHSLTLLLALDCPEQCIVTIHHALKLDPGYLRGLVYRRHIYSVYKHIREYIEYVDPIYEWKEEDDVPIDEEKAKLLIKEAETIYNAHVEQLKSEKLGLPNLTLKKQIPKLTWESIGDSLVHMHHYITENCLSHACLIEIQLEDSSVIIEEFTSTKIARKGSYVIESNIKSEKGKTKKCTRSREPNLLKQWYRYTKTLSTRGQTASQRNHKIYNTLKDLCREIQFKFNTNKIFDLVLFPIDMTEEYFGTESEENDAKEYIIKHTKNRRDIIYLLNDYLAILACKWKSVWPTALAKIFIEANTCYSTHIDIPAFVNNNNEDLLFYTRVNMLAEELAVKEKLKESTQQAHELNIIDSIELILTLNPQIFSSDDHSELIQRVLRLKIHVHVLNGSKDSALECVCQLCYEMHEDLT